MTKSIPFLVALLYAVPALPWGDTGHRIVGRIAERHLSDGAREKVRSILGTESLARAATWADEIRSDGDPRLAAFKDWHFVEIPDGETYESAHKSEKGDAIQAIKRGSEKLLDPAADAEAKREALRLLTHLVGDIHQPLHVGNGLDAGGNACLVKWFGKATNLHAVWDSKMIEETQLSYSEYAEFLDVASPADMALWQATDVVEWARESQALRDSVYPTGAAGARPYCRKSRSDDIPESVVPSLGYEYQYRFRALYERRLAQAGVRLAGLLNSLFP